MKKKAKQRLALVGAAVLLSSGIAVAGPLNEIQPRDDRSGASQVRPRGHDEDAKQPPRQRGSEKDPGAYRFCRPHRLYPGPYVILALKDFAVHLYWDDETARELKRVLIQR